MIDLTPLEVRQKKGDFRTSFRGYDGELVNDFLDLVADRMEELVKQNMELTDAVESLEEELEAYRTKERALSDALMSAQKLQEDARSHADKEGELMIREARMAAESARQEASKALAREEEALRRVRARRGQVVESFRRLLERELSELAVIEETLELEPESDEARATGPAAKKPAGESAGEPAGESAGESAAVPAEEPGLKEPGLELPASDLPASKRSKAAPPASELPTPDLPEPDLPASDLPASDLPAPDLPSPDVPAPRSAEAPDSDEADEDEDEVQEDWLKSLVEE